MSLKDDLRMNTDMWYECECKRLELRGTCSPESRHSALGIFFTAIILYMPSYSNSFGVYWCGRKSNGTSKMIVICLVSRIMLVKT